MTTLSSSRLDEHIKGCIFGGAIGDGFGLATEFMNKNQARHVYGVGPIRFGKDLEGFEFLRDGHRSRWFDNDFTDDTDQMLLILQCLLQTNGILNPKHFAFRLKEWTNFGFPEIHKVACGIGYTVGSVLSHEEFTTFPHKAAYNVWDCLKRNLAANGAVMRTSILGIPYFHNEQQVVENAMNAAKVTHADPRSVVSAVIVSVVISRLLRGKCGISSTPIQQKVTTMTIDKESCLQLLMNGTTKQDICIAVDDNSELIPKPKFPVALTDTEEKDKNSSGSFLGKIFKVSSKPKPNPSKNEDVLLRPGLPDSTAVFDRTKNAATILAEVTSMNTFGQDEEMFRLCQDVVNDYKFLVENNPLCPDIPTVEGGQTWTEQLKFYCFPDKLQDLELDEAESIGYTFKCLGAGIYAITRAIPPEMSSAEFFQRIITELALEGGDADTNCVVAGALLGCRLGLSNLPQKWITGLRHYEFLDNISNQLCDLVGKLD